VLVADKAVADYFEAALAAGREAPKVEAKTIANWITGEVFRLMRAANAEVGVVKVTAGGLVSLIRLVQAGAINQNTAKEVLGEMFESGRSSQEIVAAKGLAQISDSAALEAVVSRIVEQSPREVASYLGGKETLMGWFVGQVMRETKGKANAQVVTDLLRTRLDAERTKS
jgi:aspartyl-tRNA(Asn)/glutamyl-tRNA(Gln) amidotransferase subunit B